MLRTGNAHAGDSGALQGAEQNAAQRVTQRVAESGFDRFGNESDVIGILGVLNALEGVRNLEMGQLNDLLLVCGVL